jgi:prepilin-type N-terminal cleavage/methylation domain-containing protein/prepilin-type processing-associated H-X9-DG protein
MRNMSRKKAFTLIEILVVIGIIALLAAILFPVLSRARERARTTNCASNEKQIALSLIQYTQDNDRRFPPLNDTGTDGWSVVIGIREPNVFQCPSEEQAPADGYTDYWLNSDLMGVSNVRVRYPSNTILIGDGDAGPTGYNLAAQADATTTPPIQAWDVNADYTQRHFDGANYAFADGHVKWLKADSITTTDVAKGDNFAFRIKP